MTEKTNNNNDIVFSQTYYLNETIACLKQAIKRLDKHNQNSCPLAAEVNIKLALDYLYDAYPSIRQN